MSSNSYTMEVDHLAVGLTRPPIFMGVNMRLFFCNLMFHTLVCIDANTWLGIPCAVIAHLLMVKISIKEPNFFKLWATALMKTPPVLNSHFWGKTNSYEPW